MVLFCQNSALISSVFRKFWALSAENPRRNGPGHHQGTHSRLFSHPLKVAKNKKRQTKSKTESQGPGDVPVPTRQLPNPTDIIHPPCLSGKMNSGKIRHAGEILTEERGSGTFFGRPFQVSGSRSAEKRARPQDFAVLPRSLPRGGQHPVLLAWGRGPTSFFRGV